MIDYETYAARFASKTFDGRWVVEAELESQYKYFDTAQDVHAYFSLMIKKLAAERAAALAAFDAEFMGKV